MFQCKSSRSFSTIAAAVGLAALSLLAVAPVYAAPAEYTITDLGVLPGGTASSGRAVGYYAVVAGKADDGAGHFQAFYTLGGSATPTLIPPLPGFSDGQADGLNDSFSVPIVVGWSYNPLMDGVFPARAFVSYFGSVLDLGSLGGTNVKAHGIAGQGFIVGESEITPGSWVTHAFRTQPLSYINPATDDLGTLPGATSSFGTAVNNSAQVTGQSDGHAFRTKPFAKITAGDDLGTLGGTFSIGLSINDAGEVAGESTLASLSPVTGRPINRAFLYDSTGMHSLGVLTGMEGSLAACVNSSHQVVGFCANPAPPTNTSPGGLIEMRAFIWTKAKGMRDLNTLIDPATGWTLQAASGINYRGQITGVGIHSGQQHAFLLTPKLTIAPFPFWFPWF